MNWKIRLKNEAFWLTAIPAILLVVTSVCNAFGLKLDLGDVQEKVLAVVQAVFALLAVLGVAVDPTTKGINDSERAMQYDEPWDDNAIG